MSAPHTITRVRHPLHFRRLVVRRVETLTPKMKRIVLAGAELQGFVSLGFDDHVKLLFPDVHGVLPSPVVGATALSFPDGVPRPEARDFTPRRYDAGRQELTIDFGLHAHGPATTWATSARAGSELGVAGPRGSAVVSDTFDWHLLVGDDTALPAIARRLEELSAQANVHVVVEVDDAHEEQSCETSANAHVRWVHRRGADDDRLENVVSSLPLPDGPGFAWVAGEAAMARRIRRHLLEDRGLDKAWVKAAAYWKIGGVGKHEVLTD